jgi:AraC family transcriptional regulator
LFVPPGYALISRLSDPGQRAQPTLQLRVRGPLARPFARRWDKQALQSTLDIRNPRVTQACLRIVEEISGQDPADTAVIEALAIAAMAEISGLFGADGPARPRRGGLAPWQQRRIVDRLTDDPSPPKLAELARACGLSPRHLTRAFHQAIGCTVGDYATALRARKAQRLLADRTLAIGEIAERLGYASHAGFCQAFLRTTGLRPGEYRRIGPKPSIARRPAAAVANTH